jgi:D-alanyl-D-alanine carboxypeptidase
MTALLVLEDVKAGRYGLDSMVSAGPMAERMESSIIGFRDEKTKKPVSWSVDTLLYALMIRSANDGAVALAEHSAGTMDRFVARMNARAKSLGMKNTVYYNPNGLPPNSGRRYPWKSFNVTTCHDQAKLALEILKNHPEILKYTSRKTWKMPNGQVIINHNNVMRKDALKIVNQDGTEAVDGLKTGYINAGGSSVVLTGTNKGRRAIVIVLGSASASLRDSHARSLMVDALSAL